MCKKIKNDYLPIIASAEEDEMNFFPCFFRLVLYAHIIVPLTS